jgi:uncharacterized protein
MPPYSCNISSDKLRVYLSFEPTVDSTITCSEIINYLSKSNIAHGINEAAIQEIIEHNEPAERVIVASGKSPCPGADGKIEYLFEIDPQMAPQVKSDGSVDYRNLNLAQNVVIDQELARLIPPTIGEDGIDVFGNRIAPKSGKAVKIRKGINTSFADPEQTILKSDIDGNVKLDRSGAVVVNAAFKINENVDFNTGNIDIKGDLVVQGDVKSGFKVKASGDIEVGGTVEDAEIDADGSVFIKGGFMGNGTGIIKSGKSVILKFVHGQKVNSAQEINIHEEAIQADLTAEDAIFVHDGKGILIGGSLKAGKCAIIRVAGNVQYTKTEINVAERSGLKERTQQITKDLAGLDVKLAEITNQMMGLMNKSSRIKLNIVEENAFRLLDKLSADLTATQDSLSLELKEIEDKIRELRSIAYIKILKHIYPGCTLRIAGLVMEINEEFGPGEFRVQNGQIIHLN